MATRSPISSEIQITEQKASQAEAQRGRGIDGAPEIGIGDQPVGGGRRERGRDQADDEQQHLEDRERARGSAAVAHLLLGDGERAVERRRQRHDHGDEPPQRERVAPVDGERRVEDLADPERPQNGGAAHPRHCSDDSGQGSAGRIGCRSLG